MSLKSLIELRTKHRMAPAAVWVLVGDIPAWIEEAPDTVLVRPGHSDFDFRPLIGLHVDVFELGDNFSVLDKVIAAIDESHPKSRGLACKAGVAGLNEKHERVLQRAMELLCN